MMTIVEGFRTRDGTTDAGAVHSIVNDEYRLARRQFTGWAIDVGAHIGTVSVSLAQSNPDLRIVAVEAVPENAELLTENIERAHLTVRVFVERAWAGGPNDLTGTCHYGYRRRDEESAGYVAAHRFVGGTFGASGEPEFSLELPAVSLDGIMAKYGIDEVALLKTDCEGCEWQFLDTPAMSRVAVCVGEYHGGTSGQKNPQDRLVELLGTTHAVHFWNPEETVVGLFEATRR